MSSQPKRPPRGERLEGRVVLVTGAGRGIGAAIAQRCSEAGARVTVNYLEQEDTARRVVKDIASEGGDAIAIRADVRQSDETRRLVDETLDEFGRLDVLINNAHTPFSITEFSSLMWEDIQTQMDGVLRSAYLCTAAALPHLYTSSDAAIVNISSVTVTKPVVGMTHRTIAKAALDGFTRSLAVELAPGGIRVNGIAVGWTHTDQLSQFSESELRARTDEIPLNRLASPREVAECAVFLASALSSYLTGAVIPCSGGL